MQLSHACAAMSATFDNPNLVVSGGLVPTVALAQAVGMDRLADQYRPVTNTWRIDGGSAGGVQGALAGLDWGLA
jgi:hypothetical protein